jgi:hypothetical protein
MTGDNLSKEFAAKVATNALGQLMFDCLLEA